MNRRFILVLGGALVLLFLNLWVIFSISPDLSTVPAPIEGTPAPSDSTGDYLPLPISPKNYIHRMVRIPTRNRIDFPFRNSSWYMDSGVDENAFSPNCSKFSKGRDYDQDPIVILVSKKHAHRKWLDCDIPCVTISSCERPIAFDGVISRIPHSPHEGEITPCSKMKKIMYSMESPVYYPSLDASSRDPSFDIYATSILDSDVPLLYYSWEEYDFGNRKVPEKTANAMMATFITNCGSANTRKEYLGELMNHGISIDSYGGCNIGRPVKSDGKGGNWNARKCSLMSSYKFVAALENSNYPDYVTEKLFGPLAVGTIPIHMGDPNVHSLAPDNHSVLSVHDFPSSRHLADHLKYLDSNHTAYMSYFAWKERGYSFNFKTKIDRSIVHSMCNLCITIADQHRWEIGPAKGELSAEKLPQGVDMVLLARVRGTFWLETVSIVFGKNEESLTFHTLFTSLHRQFCPDKHVLHQITRLIHQSPKPVLKTDADVETLDNGSELEVVIIQWPEDKNTTTSTAEMGFCK